MFNTAPTITLITGCKAKRFCYSRTAKTTASEIGRRETIRQCSLLSAQSSRSSRSVRACSAKQHNSGKHRRPMFVAHACTYGARSTRVDRRYFAEANRVKWFRKDRIIRVLVEQSEHAPLLPSRYLFPSSSPYRLLRFYLAHRCLSNRTPDTIFPFLFQSVPRTIIPRFISHRGATVRFPFKWARRGPGLPRNNRSI